MYTEAMQNLGLMFDAIHANCTLSIRPLTFLNTYRSLGVIASALAECDGQLKSIPGRLLWLRVVDRLSAMPLYYHWITSGYGLFADDNPIGWFYTRGWRQAIHIETLVVHPDWRRRGVGRCLLRFAETQARLQRRRWLTIAMPVGNVPATTLCESEGFQRVHWRVVHRDAGSIDRPTEQSRVRLQRLVGLSARLCYRQFARLDLDAGETWGPDIAVGLLADIPRRMGVQQWRVWDDERPVAYLSVNGSHASPSIYLAAAPEYWGSSLVVDAIKLALSRLGEPAPGVDLRLGSNDHHVAARDGLADLGFTERPASHVRMLKRLDAGGPLPNAPLQSESANE